MNNNKSDSGIILLIKIIFAIPIIIFGIFASFLGIADK